MTLLELQDTLQNMALQHTANVSILWREVRAEEPQFAFAPDKKMVSASVIKVAIMTAVLHELQRKNQSIQIEIQVKQQDVLEDSEVFDTGPRKASIEELLTWMIVLSDNTSTNVLIDWVGMDTVNSLCAQWGMTQTSLQRKMLDFAAIEQGRNNYTSTNDTDRLYALLWRKEILTPALCDTAWHILLKQRSKNLLFRYIWEDAVAAHKTGGLDYLTHDAGVIYKPNNNYFLGVFVQDAPNIKGDPAFIGRISRLIWDYYQQ